MCDWFVYNVALPLLPVPLVYLGCWILHVKREIIEIIKDGQLCFFCTALGAVAIRDIVKITKPGVSIAWPLIGLIFILIFSTFIYGVAVLGMVSDTKGGSLVSPGRLAFVSVCAVFTTTVFVILIRWNLALL